jgi:hypothetical protein
MKNELVNVEQLENEISVIEQSHHNAILSIHENMNELVTKCDEIVIDIDSKESYENAVELKRTVKATHVAIEKKRKELKQPLIDYGKRLDKWVEQIYSPLVQAEKVVKKKMEVYEENQERLKNERKLIQEKEEQLAIELELKLKNLNGQLEKINSAKSKAELKEIESYLDGISLSDFGDKSAEAGFILNQLKLTCSMASRLIKDEEEVVIETPKIETTPITNELVEQLKTVPESTNVKKVDLKKEEVLNDNISNSVSDVKENNVVNNMFEQHENKTLLGEEKDIDSVAKVIAKEEFKKASDEDVISMIDFISNEVINHVKLLIIENSQYLLNNSTAFDKIDFSEHNELILSEVKKRIGVLLSK